MHINMSLQNETLTLTHSVFVSYRLSWFECNLKRTDRKYFKNMKKKKMIQKIRLWCVNSTMSLIIIICKKELSNREQWTMNESCDKKMKTDTKYKTRYWSISSYYSRAFAMKHFIYYDAGSVLRNMSIYISISELIQMIDCCN